MKRIKEWFELLAIIIAFALGISIYIDWRKDKSANETARNKIKELEKRKVEKNAFKNKSRTDNVNAIRRLVKRLQRTE
jgi:uncharacterized protein HemX